MNLSKAASRHGSFQSSSANGRRRGPRILSGASWRVRYRVAALVRRADEAASVRENDAEIVEAIDALAYSMVDSGPLTTEFAPSFGRALDAVQRRRKRNLRE
jgi:hypothetical protein